MKKVKIATYSQLEKLKPVGALVANVDLVIISYENQNESQASVLYGRCLHRGALLSDGYIEGENLMCGLHGWDYRYKTGTSEYENEQRLHKFSSWLEDDGVYVDEDEISQWEMQNPQAYKRDEYLGQFQDIHGTPEESYNAQIQSLAREGLEKSGHHGPVSAMGVVRSTLPNWDDLQIQTAQLAKLPLFDEAAVKSQFILGPRASKPLYMDIPLFVSDMSFGALSEEAKVALAKGAQKAGTGICSGEGGMLVEEQAANRLIFMNSLPVCLVLTWKN